METLRIFLLIAFGSVAFLARSEDPNEVSKSPPIPPIITVVRSVIETVLKHHIEPPTRQQMALDLIRSVAKLKRNPFSPDLSVTISDLQGEDQIYGLLAIELEKQGVSLAPSDSDLELIKTALRDLVPGELEIVSHSAALADEQIAANRYVGIGVQIGSLEKGKGHQFLGLIPDGPAADAGIQKLDVLEAIDGESTMDRSLVEVIQSLRGPEKTGVILKVRTADQPARDVTLLRRVVPIKSVFWADENADTGALQIRIERIAASSLNEILKIVTDYEASKTTVKTIVLDLRQTNAENLHYLHLFADGILNETTLGILKTRATSRTLKTEEGTVFGKRKIALLYTPGHVDRLDLLAQVASKSGIPVYYTQLTGPTLEHHKPASPRLILSNFPLEGTPFVVQLNATALLNEMGEQMALGPVGKNLQNPSPALRNLFSNKTNKESDLQSIVRDME